MIQSGMKKIWIIPCIWILYFCWNINNILACYMINICITFSKKITSLSFLLAWDFPLILVYNIKSYWQHTLSYFSNVKMLWHSLYCLTRLMFILLTYIIVKVWKCICNYTFLRCNIFYLHTGIFKYMYTSEYSICNKPSQVRCLWCVWIFNFWTNNRVQNSFRVSTMLSSSSFIIIYPSFLI